MTEELIKNWSIVYEKAIREDNSLFFPERLDHDFLNEAKRKMGSFLFANQYLNEIFPLDSAKFKKEWIKYYDRIPEGCYNFAFIDPAISTEDGADYTGIIVVSVDSLTRWFVRHAERIRLNPTQIVAKCFDIQRQFNCLSIGIEDVAYQKAILFMLNDEMTRRQTILPIQGFNNGTVKSKEMRIMGLIPLFEWGRIFLTQGMQDLERELLQFPRSAHDDISDALASLLNIVFYPSPEKESHEQPSPHDRRYESFIINQYARRANESLEQGD